MATSCRRPRNLHKSRRSSAVATIAEGRSRNLFSKHARGTPELGYLSISSPHGDAGRGGVGVRGNDGGSRQASRASGNRFGAIDVAGVSAIGIGDDQLVSYAAEFSIR